MTKPDYEKHLEELVAYCKTKKTSPMIADARIWALSLMNLKWWQHHIDPAMERHPYDVALELVHEAKDTIVAWDDLAWAESAENKDFSLARSETMEGMHEDLFQDLWTEYDIKKYKEDRIPRYEKRIEINDIKSLIEDKKCIDFGCGHGNFAHAMLNAGAKKVLGLDFGEGSLKHAEGLRDALGVSAEQISFKSATVYESKEPSESFDFAVQNGVFHHLEDEDKAYREVYRVLKPGGWFWVYTVGANAVIHTLFDGSRRILEDIPNEYITDRLKSMNLSTGMYYQLGDSMIAVYRFATWDSLTERLSKLGFGNFRRCVGGFSGDFGHDVIAEHAFGKEKFGEGDLRLVCQKL